jgi:hypothetical protein
MKPKNTRNRRNRLDREALPVSALREQELAASAKSEVARPRKGGMLRGKLWVADDFDAPDREIEKLFHEGDEP